MNKFDQILQETVTERQERREQLAELAHHPVSLEAKCPRDGCHAIDGYLTLEDLRVGYCATHKLMWQAGYCPATDTATQRERWAEVGADSFELVQGWLVGMKATW
jgi:hypothetical protein